jgi:hypothetical protein
MFKIANILTSQMCDAKLKIKMVKPRQTKEGEFIPFESFDMKVGEEWSGNNNIFFPYCSTIEHIIDENSPLYPICKPYLDAKNSVNHSFSNNNNINKHLMESFEANDYEIIVILEGNIETTGNNFVKTFCNSHST